MTKIGAARLSLARHPEGRLSRLHRAYGVPMVFDVAQFPARAPPIGEWWRIGQAPQRSQIV